MPFGVRRRGTGPARSPGFGGAAVLAALLAACATPAPDSRPDIADPGPDFGYIPDATGIVQPGRAYLETSALLQRGPASDERAFALPLLARVGVVEDWELRVQAWPVQAVDDGDGSETGAGPVQVGFKTRFTRGGKGPLEPAWGLEVEALLPIASEALDLDHVQPSAWVAADHRLSAAGTLTWNAGFVTPLDEDGDLTLQGLAAWAYAHTVSPTVQLYATGSWAYPTPQDSTLAVLGAGLYAYLSARVVLVAGYNAGLTRETPDGLATLGSSFAF